jgi:hypothetical protein
MAFRVISALSQWALYFAPTLVAFGRKRLGKSIPVSFGLLFFANLTLAGQWWGGFC